MKTTLEIPDSVFRRAKAMAAERNMPLCRFVGEALTEKVEARSGSRQSARMKLAGKLRHLRKESLRIGKLIEEEFERIEPEEWA